MNSTISQRKIYTIVLVTIYIAFMFVKFTFGELTPDEILFTNDSEIDTSNVIYIWFNFIFSFLYRIGKFFLPLINITFIFYLFNRLYLKEVIQKKSLSKNVLLLLFILPSVIYFTSAYLRDIYVYILTLVLTFNSNVFRSWKKVFLILILIFFLRIELFLVLVLSLGVDYILTYKKRPFIFVNRFTIPIIILCSWLILIGLFSFDFIWEFTDFFISRYEISKPYYGIMQVSITKANVISGSLLNWFAFYVPFLFKKITAPFDYFILLDSIIICFLFIRFFIKFKSSEFKINKLYRLCFYTFMISFFIALPESLPETMFRHRMAYIPFLIYLNYGKLTTINLKLN